MGILEFYGYVTNLGLLGDRDDVGGRDRWVYIFRGVD